MSHAATHWLATVPPKTLTHGEFRVLFHLCDCHNPSRGCFPAQTYLRQKTGASNGGLNNWLSGLEEKNFIRRERIIDPVTKRQKETRYTFAFEFELTASGGERTEEELLAPPTPPSGDGVEGTPAAPPTPFSGAGAVSTFGADPSPLIGTTRLQIGGDGIDEPVKEPVKNHNAGEPAGGFSDLFEKFFRNYPNPVERRSAEREWRKALARGADALSIVGAAMNYAGTKEVKRGFVKKPANWLSSDAWRDHVGQVASTPSKAAIDATTASLIKGGNRTVAQQVSSHRVCELLHAGLITVDDCQRAGLRL
ncbi:hypothetical protein JI58_01240 [Marinosulfonomonas sp. PRT-SC04]|nr:hypothetical protein JI58_01240 [Marinosulfonomonas sp. PRT-SC04]